MSGAGGVHLPSATSLHNLPSSDDSIQARYMGSLIVPPFPKPLECRLRSRLMFSPNRCFNGTRKQVSSQWRGAYVASGRRQVCEQTSRTRIALEVRGSLLERRITI